MPDLEISEPVSWFATQMQTKLNENKHKGGWQNCEFAYLLQRLREEVDEVTDVLLTHPNKTDRLIRECADVANFAMMIADIARATAITDWTAKAVSVLRTDEWVFDTDLDEHFCPVCSSSFVSGHESDCKLAEVLRLSEEQSKEA